MKNLISGNVFVACFFAALNIFAQPVAKTDAVALFDELPAPPASLADAYRRAYLGGATGADAKTYYNDWFAKLEKAGLENQELQKQYYLKNPMGVRPAAQPVSRATPQQQASMDAATSELAQKMLNDPAFAQKFMQMSEQEQHAYIAKLLADKGLKPVNGTPNAEVAPPPGSDMPWTELISAFSQSATDMSRWEAQSALQQKYSDKHREVDAWTEAEIKKLPMISYGEYGHDHDPEKVQAVKKQGLGKHRDLADAMMKESAELFVQFRQQSRERMTPLNDALKKVNFGANYDFGINYSSVLGAQMFLLQEPNVLLTNEIEVINEVARWEHEWRNFK